jgi:hypothetical protein
MLLTSRKVEAMSAIARWMLHKAHGEPYRAVWRSRSRRPGLFRVSGLRGGPDCVRLAACLPAKVPGATPGKGRCMW